MGKVNGLLAGAIVTALIAGCSSPRDPFLNRMQRPSEQCLADHYEVENPQTAFGDRQVLRYVVKKGDTLWSIAKRFLVKPWYWKTLWYDNPQIRNPHLIYPGDVLSVVTLNGEKRITITEGNGMYHGTNTGRRTKDGRAIYKYKPGAREYNLNDEPITIANKIVAPFLLHTEILQPEQIKTLPTIFGNAGDYLTLSQQQEIYSKFLPEGIDTTKRHSEVGIYRIGAKLVDYQQLINQHKGKNTNSGLLGYQMDYIGKAAVEGIDVSSGLYKLTPMVVAQTMQEGDVLMAIDAHSDADYFPRLPSPQCNRGYMLTNTNTQTTMVKEFDTVITSFGRDNGAQVGDIWKIVRPGLPRVINGSPVQIPAKDLGYLMIIRVYNDFSMGFVLDSTQNIDLTDWLVRP